MTYRRILIPFKYKLSIIFFVIVVMISSFLGIFQYLHLQKVMYKEFGKDTELVRDNIINSVKDCDYFYLMLEKHLEPDGKDILDRVLFQYEKNKQFNFDLNTFVQGKKGFDIYIVDNTNRIAFTTNETKLGLNYNNFPEFIKLFSSIYKNKAYFADRVNTAVNSSDLEKACYIPTPDNKYIIKVGIKMEEYVNEFQGIGFNNFEKRITSQNDFINSVILYDSTGNGFKKGNYEIPSHIDYEYMKYLKQAISTMKVVKMQDIYNDKPAFYEYIPYRIMDASGVNKVNVIEVVYNDFELQKNLRDNIKNILIVVIAGALISLIFGFYLAANIAKPIKKFTEATKKISDGDFDLKINIKSNDEFRILGKSFEKMAKDIASLINDLTEREKDLQKKNHEIFYQNEEINALYEETAAMNDELENLINENNKNYLETVRSLSSAIEAKDSYTGGHSERVKIYSMGIADILELDTQSLLELEFGSLLHDIGKIGIPEEILNKNAIFNDEEYALIKKHPIIGHDILKEVHFLTNSQRIVLEHHERIDGKGYPQGLKGDDISLLARIVCVADAYDAMTSSRAYRKIPLTKEKAVKEMIDNKGTQFDSIVVDGFLKWLELNEQKKIV